MAKEAAEKTTDKVNTNSEQKNKLVLVIVGIVVSIAAIIGITFGVVNLIKGPDISGTYELTGLEENGEDQSSSISLYNALGLTFSLELKSDHTGTISVFGQSNDLTYDRNKMKYEDSEVEYTYKDGAITLETESVKLIFTKKSK